MRQSVHDREAGPWGRSGAPLGGLDTCSAHAVAHVAHVARAHRMCITCAPHVHRTCIARAPHVHCMCIARAQHALHARGTATTHHSCIARCTAATAVSTSAERSPAHSEDIDMRPARAAGFAAM
mgnify:CR=1 FL=1